MKFCRTLKIPVVLYWEFFFEAGRVKQMMKQFRVVLRIIVIDYRGRVSKISKSDDNV